MFITYNHASFHLWREENLVKHQEVSKYYDHDCSFMMISQSLQSIPWVSFNDYFHVNFSLLLHMSHLFYTIRKIIVCIVGKDDENEMVFKLLVKKTSVFKNIC